MRDTEPSTEQPPSRCLQQEEKPAISKTSSREALSTRQIQVVLKCLVPGNIRTLTPKFFIAYVTILNIDKFNILGVVREWPFNVTGVIQLGSQTRSFVCSAANPAHASHIPLGVSAEDQAILLHGRSGKTSSAQGKKGPSQ